MESAQKANFKDPGWNDPPTFTYDKATAIQANSSKKGISLNKRVAFPMSGNIPKENNAIDPTAPPADFDLSKVGTPPMGPVKLPPSTTTTAETTTETVDTTEPNLSSNDRLHKVVTNLRTVAKIKSDDEINKRINVMRNMWLDGKLDTDVQLKLHSLSEALISGDVEKADHIQKGLMVDHVAQCSTWMSAIRHLINVKREDMAL